MSSVVVSDSACLIGLERIGQLDLLPKLFAEIFVPPAVATEFGVRLNWLKIQAPTDAAEVAAFQSLVDEGEGEAIALAKQLGCEVILDDLQARKLAARQKVACIGLLGVLIRAKDAGLVKEIRSRIEALREQNFYFSDALVAKALRLAGE